MTQPPQDHSHPHWTLDGFRLGALQVLPLMPGLVAFGLAFGTIAARKGFSLLDAVLMSGVVFAGMAQILTLEAWPDTLTLASVTSAALIAGTVSARFLLIGASLRPWLGTSPPSKVYPTLYLLTETSWILSIRYRADGGNDPAHLIGSGLVTWCFWVASTIPGYWLGASLADPRVFGLDLVMPVFFTAMLVPLWRGHRRAAGWAAGGAVALAVDQLIGGWWYVVAGALAGAIVGGLADDGK